MPIRTGYANLLNDPLPGPVTSNTFTGPQDLIAGTVAPAAQPCLIPANYIKDGGTYRTTAAGTFSTTGTPTLVFGLYFGTTVLAVSVAFTTASGAVTLPWRFQVETVVYSSNPNTAIVTDTSGYLHFGTTVAAITQQPVPGIAQASVNIDNSAAQLWAVKATYSASSSSNIVILRKWIVEELTQI
jgi:hypothetical protein